MPCHPTTSPRSCRACAATVARSSLTVHDLRNPHHHERDLHDAQLGVLVEAADAVLTLTPGAAAEIAERWGREALVVPHPHVVDGAAALRVRGPAHDGFVIGVHAKSLRAGMDPLPGHRGDRRHPSRPAGRPAPRRCPHRRHDARTAPDTRATSSPGCASSPTRTASTCACTTTSATTSCGTTSSLSTSRCCPTASARTRAGSRPATTSGRRSSPPTAATTPTSARASSTARRDPLPPRRCSSSLRDALVSRLPRAPVVAGRPGGAPTRAPSRSRGCTSRCMPTSLATAARAGCRVRVVILAASRRTRSRSRSPVAWSR